MNEKNKELLFAVYARKEDVEGEIEERYNKILNLLKNENYQTMSYQTNIDFYISKLKELRDKAEEHDRLVAEIRTIHSVRYIGSDD